MSKQEYIDNIVKKLNECSDMSLIDLILQLLSKSI